MFACLGAGSWDSGKEGAQDPTAWKVTDIGLVPNPCNCKPLAVSTKGNRETGCRCITNRHNTICTQGLSCTEKGVRAFGLFFKIIGLLS